MCGLVKSLESSVHPLGIRFIALIASIASIASIALIGFVGFVEFYVKKLVCVF